MTDKQIRVILKPFEDDLWLERRFKLDGIIGRIDGYRTQGGGSCSDQWITFIRFLDEECSGKYFNNDKEWNELLNLMQINRLINHKTLRLRDLINNRDNIDLNRHQIKQFNERVKWSNNFEASLNELQDFVDTIQLDINSKVIEEPKLLIEKLSASIDQLNDRCFPILTTLKSELERHDSIRDQILETWSSRLIELESIVKKVNLFLINFHQLQMHLQHLKPLISLDKPDEPTKGTMRVTPAVDGSLVRCRIIILAICEYNLKVSKFLVSRSVKDRSKNYNLNLVKLFKEMRTNEESLLISQLEIKLNELIRCRETLDGVLRDLRLEFGRFYFLSDLDLLKIIYLDKKLISNGDIESKRLIGKLYNGAIDSFIMNHGNDGVCITGVTSPNGEDIYFIDEDPVPLSKKINIYSLEIVRILNEAMRKLRRSLKRLFLANLSSPIIDWSLPVQIRNLLEQVTFCQRVEHAFLDKIRWDDLIEFYHNRLHELTEKSRKTQSTWISTYKISAAISLTVQFISILKQLNLHEVTSIHDWIWQKQIRYAVVKDRNEDQLQVQMLDFNFIYRFDLLPLQLQHSGQQSDMSYKRLISTKMTERCQLTAGHSLKRFRLGANPFGPAGSGKTETIKALGHHLGCQVIVHNCDESNDAKSLVRLIWGLAHTGIWGCFDEFNRLSMSVLSEVSESLELIQSSLKCELTTVQERDGSLMSLDKDSAFFITLNPLDKDNRYKGRRRLPANLRSLFQPIAMVKIPIDSLVDETLMISESANTKADPRVFSNLSSRLQTLLDAMKSSSRTNNCEWDLRLVVAILYRLRLQKGQGSIERRLIEALRTEVECRLGKRDLDLFRKNLVKIFEVDVDFTKPIELHPEFRLKLLKCKPINIDDNVLSNHIELAMNLYQQLQTRTGVILLGPTKSGKSTSWRWLQSAMSDKVRMFYLNPRSCGGKLEHLLGFRDATTEKWVDGLLTTRFREAISTIQDASNIEQVWLVMDGPIDPDWIESLNSVLDDNRVLTLSSGEQLDLDMTIVREGSNRTVGSIKLIFEVDSIEYASPATVSRLGLVYHENPILSEPTEKIPNTLRLLDDTSRLLFISDSDIISEMKSIRSIEYFCSQYSQSNHLLSVIRYAISTGYKYIFLRNIELIEPENQWCLKSFLEMLRFIITYEGFHDPEKYWSFIKLKELKFVIVSEYFDALDTRTQSITDSILQISREETSERNNITCSEIHELSSLIMDKCGIITVESSGYDVDILKQRIFTDLESCKMRSFDNSIMIKTSLEEMEIHLIGGGINGELSKMAFVLTEPQLQLMEIAYKRKLFHLMNLSLWRSRSNKFIYISQSEPDPFWRSVSHIIRLKEYHSSLMDSKRLRSDIEASIDGYGQRFSGSEKIVEAIQDLIKDVVQSDIRLTQNINDSFIKLFISLTNRYQTYLCNQQRTLRTGLDKLRKFEMNIESVRENSNSEREKLSIKGNEINKLMQSIDIYLKEADSRRETINELKKSRDITASRLREKQITMEAEMSNVVKILESSKRDIKNHLKPEALNEIRTLRSPPKVIKDIMDALSLMFNVQDSTWASMKAFLARSSLRDELTNFKIETGGDLSYISKIEALMKDPEKHGSFEIENANRASKAVVPILNWIKAILEYGKVCIKLNPMEIEMSNIKREQKTLADEIKYLEVELKKLDEKVSIESSKLNKLKKEFYEIENGTNKLGGVIKLASEVLGSSKGQVERWTERLGIIDNMLKQGEPIKLATFTAFTASFPIHSNLKWMKKLELWLEKWILSSKKLRPIDKIMSFLLERENLEVSFANLNNNDSTKMNILVALKVQLDSNVYIPFIEIPRMSPTDQVIDELIKYLSHGQSICRNGRDVVVIRCDELSIDWIKRLEAASRSNLLVILYLGNSNNASGKSSEGSSTSRSHDLNVLDYLTRGNDREGFTSKHKVLLVGNIDEHQIASDYINYPVRLFKLSELSESKSQIESTIRNTILDYLVENFDPELSKLINKLETQLKDKQFSVNQLEARLIRQLAASSMDSIEDTKENNGIDEDIVKVLSQLRDLCESLGLDVVHLEEKLNETKLKKENFLSSASDASKFYQAHLMPLGDINKFYRVSLVNYCKKLLENCNSKSNELDYNNVCRQIVWSMKPSDGSKFLKSLEVEMRNTIITTPMTTTTTTRRESKITQKGLFDRSNSNELEEAIRYLMSDSSGEICEPKLMIALHESVKSSPQLEVDEIFMGKLSNELEYCKVYATSETNNNKLESFFSNYFKPDYDNNLKNERISSNNKGKLRKCLCIANAHLASKWINSRLIYLFESLTKQEKYEFYVILIGEFQTDKDNEFDSNVLNLAKVKYWHDELNLSLMNRYKLLVGSFGFETRNGKIIEENKINEEPECELVDLSRRLILFHVICQEKTRPQGGVTEGESFPISNWMGTYLFDHDKLSKALRTLNALYKQCNRIGERAQGNNNNYNNNRNTSNGSSRLELRRLLCNYLEFILYGALMETDGDTLQLKALITGIFDDSSRSDIKRNLAILASNSNINSSEIQIQESWLRKFLPSIDKL